LLGPTYVYLYHDMTGGGVPFRAHNKMDITSWMNSTSSRTNGPMVWEATWKMQKALKWKKKGPAILPPKI